MHLMSPSGWPTGDVSLVRSFDVIRKAHGKMAGCVAVGIVAPEDCKLGESSLRIQSSCRDGASLAETRLFCGRDLQNSNRCRSINVMLFKNLIGHNWRGWPRRKRG